MAIAMRAALLRFGQWEISYDLGRQALINIFGTHQAQYQALRNALIAAGFVMVQQSVYRHPGCLLFNAIATIAGIVGGFGWMQLFDATGAPTVRSLKLSVTTALLDFTVFAQLALPAAIPVFPII